MKLNNLTFRSTLGRIRGLGSAKSGTHEWYAMRITSLALLVLLVYPLLGLFIYQLEGGRAAAVEWLRSLFVATGIILFLIAGFHHGAYGLKNVIEDYVHSHFVKTALLFVIMAGSAACALLGIIATLKITLGI